MVPKVNNQPFCYSDYSSKLIKVASEGPQEVLVSVPGVPQQEGESYFHYNSIHKVTQRLLCSWLSHTFCNKTSKAKVLSDGEAWHIIWDERLGVIWHEKVWEPLLYILKKKVPKGRLKKPTTVQSSTTFQKTCLISTIYHNSSRLGNYFPAYVSNISIASRTQSMINIWT